MNDLNARIPSHLLPINRLVGALEVTGEVREKTDQNGTVKYSEPFGNVPGWIVPVELIHSVRDKQLPDGTTAQVLETVRQNVTVWSAVRPSAPVGSYVVLDSPMAGAYDGSIYVQALGISPASDSLDDVLGGGE